MEGSVEGVSPYRSPDRYHQTDYSLKNKMQHLERELKSLQGKYDQLNIENKGSSTKKDILERSLKDSEGQLRIVREKYSDL